MKADTIVHARMLAPCERSRIPDGAVASLDGQIIAVGTHSEVDGLRGPRTTVHALDGLVIPGFFDSHNHMLTTGLGMLRPGLGACSTITAVLGVVAEEAKRTQSGQWVVTSPAWHESNLQENRLPTATELDAVAGDHPVFMRRGGHNLVLNRRALELLGVEETHSDEPGTTVIRDSAGRPTGHVIGTTYVSRLAAMLPPTSESDKREALQTAGRAYAAAGITSLVEPGLTVEDIDLFRRLGRERTLPVRVRMLWRIARSDAEVDRAITLLRGRESLSRFREDWASLFGLKLSADGGVETGFYREPYERPDDPACPRGKPLMGRDALARICEAAAETGWLVGVHCVGDAAVDDVLAAYEAADARSSLTDRRWSLIHMMYPRSDHWPRARRLGLSVAAQQPLQFALSAGFHHYIGAARARDIEPLRAYLTEIDRPVGGGSDSPVAPFEPLIGIASSVTRSTRGAGIVGPEWAISVPEALTMYTTSSAWTAFEEDRVGTLTVGKFADLTCLSHDVLANPETIGDARVMWTMSGGQVSYEE